MPPLRLTVPLCLLVLGASVAGTAWLSDKTYDRAWRPPRLAAAARPVSAGPASLAHAPARKAARARAHGQHAHALLAAARQHQHPAPVPHRASPLQPAQNAVARAARLPVPGPAAPAWRPADGMAELVPVATPSTPVPYAAMRGHLSGSLVLRVWVDGSGQVADAQVAASSGDPALDAHALTSVRRWRFAVPADKPDGITGELPVRFDEPGEGLARGT